MITVSYVCNVTCEMCDSLYECYLQIHRNVFRINLTKYAFEDYCLLVCDAV
jgi:hypothetical protein